MKAKIYISLLMISFCSSLFAHQGIIKGTVIDSLSLNGLPYVSVMLEGDNKKQSVITNDFGIFSFSDLEIGKYKLSFFIFGYTSKTIFVELKDDEIKTIPITILLNRNILKLSEITVKDSKDLGQTINTVSKIDMLVRPINSAQDMLRLVPGLFLAQHQGGGKAEQIFLRGFDCDHGTDFAVFLDGMPVNMVSHAHGQGYADFHFVIPETIDKLSVSKGPYAAKYGDFATAGAGEFTTKNYLDRNMVKLEYGNYDTYRAVAMVNLLSKKQLNDSILSQSAYVAGEYNYTNSYFDNKQHYFRYNIFGKYTARYKEKTLINFSASTFNSSWDASGQVPTRAVTQGLISRYGSVDPTEGGTTNRTNINLAITSNINNHSIFKNRFFYSNYNFNLYSNFTFFLVDTVRGDQINQTEKGRNMYGYTGSYETNTYLGEKKLSTVIGLSSRTDMSEVMLRHSQHRTVLDTFVVGNLFQENAAAYIDETLQLTEKFTVNAAIRADYFLFSFKNLKTDSLSGIKQVFKPSPKLNITYNVTNNTQLFAHVGYGFHSNDARSVVQQQVKNQNNVPTALGYEIGATFKPFKNILINAALWGIDLQSELVYEGDVGVIAVTGATRRLGVDVSLRWQLYKSLFFDADINYAHSQQLNAPKNQSYLPLSPVLTSVAGLSVKSKKGFGGSLRYRYMSNRPANEDNSIQAMGYFLVDAVVNYTTSRFQFGLSAENILNTTWNQAQFETLSRLKNEKTAVDELNFTPGTPFFAKGSIAFYF